MDVQTEPQNTPRGLSDVMWAPVRSNRRRTCEQRWNFHLDHLDSKFSLRQTDQEKRFKIPLEFDERQDSDSARPRTFQAKKVKNLRGGVYQGIVTLNSNFVTFVPKRWQNSFEW